MVDLCIWIFCFIPRLIIQLIKPKRKKGKSVTVEQSINQINYKTMCVCQNCGNTWLRSQMTSSMASDIVKSNVKKLNKNLK